ncbi:hypothetical protein DNTS_024796 [Danionella cerebrum]|uniref:MOB kinase activator 2 n=1 Tax=Danionella cerebrum TaxID=2873325 RepID=A0A553MZQ8_9TELE|nr:hypothetical protein DNTS_024796 [Danionella translucida]
MSKTGGTCLSASAETQLEPLYTDSQTHASQTVQDSEVDNMPNRSCSACAGLTAGGARSLAMGGCQSYNSSDEEDISTLKANYSNISLFKVKNNSLHILPSAEVKPYLKDHFLSRRIIDSDLLTLCALPLGLDQQEWIAANTVSFFHHTTLFCSALSDCCSTTTCPATRNPGNILYEWTDEQGKKMKCSAPIYIDYAMSYIQEILTDVRVFPTKTGSSFPAGFLFLIQKIFMMLFRTLAHLFSVHYQDAVAVELHPHLNTVFTHFITFSHIFRLLEPSETAPIDDLIAALAR